MDNVIEAMEMRFCRSRYRGRRRRYTQSHELRDPED